MITLTWWELEELTDHLHDREDIWSYDEQSVTWVRQNTEGTLLCAFRLRGPSNDGPYRQFQIVPVPFDWDGPTTDDYLLHLCTGWTSYGVRMEAAKLLMEDEGMKLSPQAAMAITIAVLRVGQDALPAGEFVAAPTDGELFPGEHHTLPPVREHRFVHFYGGFFNITRAGGMFSINMSINSGKPGQGSNGMFAHYTGHIRPRHGDADRAAEYLFHGVTLEPDVPEGDPNSRNADESEEDLLCLQSSIPTEVSSILQPEVMSVPEPSTTETLTQTSPDSSTSLTVSESTGGSSRKESFPTDPDGL
jgi:hypothetical protein